MNIFYLHNDPKKAVSYHYNRHVVKMPLEAAQMLCTAHHVLGEENDYDTSYVPYKKVHMNHPCSIWVRANAENYMWTYEYMIELGREYSNRYGKIHKTIITCRDLLYTLPKHIPTDPFTQPPQCMPDEYKVTNDSVEAYWNYYIHDKKRIITKTETAYESIPAL